MTLLVPQRWIIKLVRPVGDCQTQQCACDHIRGVVTIIHGSADSDEGGGHEGDAAEPGGDCVAAAVEQVELACEVEREVGETGERGGCVTGGEAAESVTEGLVVYADGADYVRD